MPFDQSNSPAPGPTPATSQGEAAPLSRQLTHFAVMKLVRIIKRGNDLAYSRTSPLSEFEWRVLTRVCDTPGMSINELGVLLDRSVAQVSRTVRRLADLGLVRRENVGGGPGVAISPTPEGETAYAPLVDVAVRSERELTAGLSEAELKIFDGLIAVMTENALQRLAREQRLQSEANGGPDGD